MRVRVRVVGEKERRGEERCENSSQFMFSLSPVGLRGTYEREKHGAETDDRVEWERRNIITSCYDSANYNK